MYRCILLTWLLVLAACSSGGGREHIRQNDPVALPEQAFTLSGTVQQGGLSGATVRVFQPGSAMAVASSVTDEVGRYQLALPATLYRSPLIVEVGLEQLATMRCDVAFGCEGVAFGEVATLAPDSTFKLSALVQEATEQTPANVSLVTTLAYRLQQILPATSVAERFYQANNTVGMALGLTQRLEAIESVDLTDPIALADAPLLSVRQALINSALLDAVLMANPGLSIAEAVARAPVDVLGGGAVGQMPLPTLGVAGVYRAALDLASSMNLNAISVARVTSLLTSELAYFKQRNETPFIRDSLGYVGLLASPLQQAKNVVQDVRQVANTLDFASLLSLQNFEDLSIDKIFKVSEVFGLQLTENNDLSGLTQLVDVLGRLTPAILSVVSAHYGGDAIPSEVDGITVDVDINDVPVGEDEFVFRFDQTLTLCEGAASECDANVDMIVRVLVSVIGGSTGNNTFQFGGEIQLSGSLQQGEQFLVMQEGALLDVVELTTRIEYADASNTQISKVNFWGRGLTVSLPFDFYPSVSQEPDKVLSADLVLEATVLDFIYETNTAVDQQEGFFYHLETTVFNLTQAYNLMFGLSLKEQLTASEDKAFVLNVKQAGGLFDSGLSLTTETLYQCPGALYDEGQCSATADGSTFGGEDGDQFLQLAITLLGSSSAYTNTDNATMAILGERISPTRNSVDNLRSMGNDRGISLKGTFNNAGGIMTLDGVNFDGAKVHIVSEDGDREGFVRNQSGSEMVDMLDMGEWLKFTYSDGSFDSL